MSAWIVGLAVSLVGGWVGTWAFLGIFRKLYKLYPLPSAGDAGVPAWLTGIVERAFFTFLVAFGVQAVAPAMVGWLALKLASNWNHPATPNKRTTRANAFLALLAGLISMGFAYVGGLICFGTIHVGT